MSRLWRFVGLGSLALLLPSAWAADEGSTAASEDAAADFNQELLTVEQQVDDLKERVFRSKATLQLLKEIVIAGASSGSKATVWHINRLGTAYKLESITYMLDGATAFSRGDATGGLSDSKEIKIREGAITPGDHNLSVDFRIRPTGFGVFSYAKNYEVNVRSNYAFTVEVGKQCTVRTTLTDRGGLADSFEQRAKASFEIKCERITE